MARTHDYILRHAVPLVSVGFTPNSVNAQMPSLPNKNTMPERSPASASTCHAYTEEQWLVAVRRYLGYGYVGRLHPGVHLLRLQQLDQAEPILHGPPRRLPLPQLPARLPHPTTRLTRGTLERPVQASQTHHTPPAAHHRQLRRCPQPYRQNHGCYHRRPAQRPFTTSTSTRSTPRRRSKSTGPKSQINSSLQYFELPSVRSSPTTASATPQRRPGALPPHSPPSAASPLASSTPKTPSINALFPKFMLAASLPAVRFRQPECSAPGAPGRPGSDMGGTRGSLIMRGGGQ